MESLMNSKERGTGTSPNPDYTPVLPAGPPVPVRGHTEVKHERRASH